MIYGITGSSGSGKSTLARQTAEMMAITFLPTSITKSAERHGFTAVGDLDPHSRINLQYHLLDDILELIAKCNRPAILDRTPVDMIAYMTCEFGMHSHKGVSDADLAKVEAYIDLCLDATATHFDHVFFVNRLDFYEVKDTRPAANPAYTAHTDLVMRGAMARLEGSVNLSIIEPTDINIRLQHVCHIIEQRLNMIGDERKAAKLN